MLALESAEVHIGLPFSAPWFAFFRPLLPEQPWPPSPMSRLTSFGPPFLRNGGTTESPAVHATPTRPDGGVKRNGFGLEDSSSADEDTTAERLWREGRAELAAADPTVGRPEAVLEAEGPGSGVHAITKKTNYWFEREVHVIERKAEQWAAEWAQKGLPRHDVPRTEVLQPEQVLAGLSSQVFRDWQLRVRTKMQDAIQEAGDQLAEHVAALRSYVTRLEAARSEGTELGQRIRELEETAKRDLRPVRYDRLIPAKLFWPAAIVLALVEFVANFPVFRLLLPMSGALTRAAEELAGNVDDRSFFAGPLMLMHEMTLHIEAFIVALVAVVVLVLLGKTFGSSLRPLRVFQEAEHPLAAETIRAHRRQHSLLAFGAGAGALLVLAFLFASRRDIAQTAAARVTADSIQLARALAGQASISGDRAKLAASILRTRDLERTLQRHQDDASYATTVQRNNTPILLLNLALIITAAILGFSYKSEDLGEKRGEHPGIAPLRVRQRELERELFDIVREGRSSAGLAQAAIGRALHLVRAEPLRGWESKQARLESVIPRFRGENCRLRGLDPANVRAFDDPPALDLAVVDIERPLCEPTDFDVLREEFTALSRKFTQLAPRFTPASGTPVIA